MALAASAAAYAREMAQTGRFAHAEQPQGPTREGENLFTGAVWTGRQALERGLVDGLGDIRSTLRARYGERVDIQLIAEARGSFLARLLRRAAPGGVAALAGEAITSVEERAAWARLGL